MLTLVIERTEPQWPLDKLDAPLLFNQAVAQGFYEADLAHYHYRYLNIGENEIIGEVISFLRNHEKKRCSKGFAPKRAVTNGL